MAGRPQPLVFPRVEPPSEDVYRSLCAALEASARGRAFLAEHARRSRNGDTQVVLAAIDRLSVHMRANSAAVGAMRKDLRELIAAIRLIRSDGGPEPGKVAMLTELVDLLEQRIDAGVEPESGENAADDGARPQLAVVPPAEEPELPIPSPLIETPAIAVVPAKPSTRVALMPDVNVLDSAPAGAKPQPPAASAVMPPPASLRPIAAKADAGTERRMRILAPIMALSEDERLALFT